LPGGADGDCSFLAPAELGSGGAALPRLPPRKSGLSGCTGRYREQASGKPCGRQDAEKLVLTSWFSSSPLGPENVFQKGLDVSLFWAAGLVSTRPSSAEIRIRVFAEVRECSVPFFRGAEIGLAGR